MAAGANYFALGQDAGLPSELSAVIRQKEPGRLRRPCIGDTLKTLFQFRVFALQMGYVTVASFIPQYESRNSDDPHSDPHGPDRVNQINFRPDQFGQRVDYFFPH
jgi:hypothetical protein